MWQKSTNAAARAESSSCGAPVGSASFFPSASRLRDDSLLLVEERQHRISFRSVRAARIRQFVRAVDLRAQVGSSFPNHASGKGLCPIEDNLAVQQGQRLRRRDRCVSPSARFVRVRHIERFEHRDIGCCAGQRCTRCGDWRSSGFETVQPPRGVGMPAGSSGMTLGPPTLVFEHTRDGKRRSRGSPRLPAAAVGNAREGDFASRLSRMLRC